MTDLATDPLNDMLERLPDAFRLGTVRLAVTDLERSVEFYERVIGMQLLATTDGVADLGSGDGEVVLQLVEERDASRPGVHAGLYHVALLFPSRVELGRVAARIALASARIQGASDHHTHEAIYLADPDGNGLELAADRPPEVWPGPEDIEGHRPLPLDIPGLLELAGDDIPERAEPGLRVGHLHLHVGSIPDALTFYVEAIGFDPMLNIGSAGFVSAGGYHHHLGFNVWKGVGVPPLPSGVIGLRHWTGIVPSADDVQEIAQRLERRGHPVEWDEGTLIVRDPWNQELRFQPVP